MSVTRLCRSLHQSNFRPFLSDAKSINLISKMVFASLHNSNPSDGSDLPDGDVHVPLDSILNLRRIDAHGKLYRSAKQDKASPEDIKHLQSLGIRTHLDLRSKTEYLRESTPKAIDHIVGVLIPKSLPDPKVKPYPIDIPMKGLKKKIVDVKDLSQRRYLIDFFSFELAMKTFNSAPLYKRLLALCVLVFDIIMGNNFKHFVRMFKDTINDHGLSGQYIDMLEFGGKQLCFVLRTVSNPDNLPALVSCAHGKDRTGIVTAMILSILGKSDEYIAEEYAMSEEGLKPIRSSVRDDIVLQFRFDESFATAKKETMLKVLEYLRDRYGSIENFLESLGFGKEEQERLRQVLS
ncbi:uncharacterized protein [Asterias amurensis]|uniref:uncharacterized protein n=1 Tax=Asterias amurensis TaxID=7602 RepID=UPI003AB15EB6